MTEKTPYPLVSSGMHGNCAKALRYKTEIKSFI
jgi:hypothetical protein